MSDEEKKISRYYEDEIGICEDIYTELTNKYILAEEYSYICRKKLLLESVEVKSALSQIKKMAWFEGEMNDLVNSLFQKYVFIIREYMGTGILCSEMKLLPNIPLPSLGNGMQYSSDIHHKEGKFENMPSGTYRLPYSSPEWASLKFNCHVKIMQDGYDVKDIYIDPLVESDKYSFLVTVPDGGPATIYYSATLYM